VTPTPAPPAGTEAQLFYHPTPGGDVDTMVDPMGRAYALLPNAYKYRKTLVQGCRCRPQPWSEAELARHRAYADGRAAVAEAHPAASPKGDPGRAQPDHLPGPSETADLPSRMPGPGEPGAIVIDAERAVARPPPIARTQYLWPWEDPRPGR